ncbi:hypothetical protein MVES1_003339 [Malassezia vespertilionis]|uniref:SigF-like NTF2-like domain-containing protein n=1 Tax=Malassezia vespertilionis TaxID=2020962 RepID=A0A2N1J7A9_9BASI|nr:uncharacterized protein MVES1_003339 [Malassezia vespertilionis]PKI82446.1 hypothetical protein MVES_003582 [Malassezia vespertilionis]WFD07970.1 hypothetical protein MVES1_003339 [Malassezia vespertilionis]
MEHPVREIKGVVRGLVCAKNAQEQRATAQKYMTPNASFDHPMCAVPSFPGSRDSGLLPIYQWLRIMFMDTLIDIHSVAYDEDNEKIYLSATQTLRCNVPLIRYIIVPKPSLFVCLDLVRTDGKYYITKQTDVYAVQEIFGMLGPWLFCVVMLIKYFTGFFCLLLASPFQFLGFWNPGSQRIKLSADEQ